MTPIHGIKWFSRIFAVFEHPRRFVVSAALALVVLIAAGSASALPGDLDSTFSGSGFALGAAGATATGVAVQSDGKIVAGGGQFVLARYNPDGSLDTSLGSGGSTQPLGFGDAHAVVLQPDGKSVVAGSRCYPCAFALARFSADGSLDTGFGSGGVAFASFSPSASYNDFGAMALALQNDGKLVAVGNVGDAFGNNAFGVVRFNPDGSLDSGFGSGGLAMATFYYWEQADVRAVAIQPDGKIVVGGSAAGQFVLARFNPDGTLDGTFGSGGVARPAFGYAYAVSLQGDGKIVAAGQDLSSQLEVARVNADGSPDESFGSGGTATMNFLPTAVYVAALAVQVQTNGKLVTVGTASGNNTFFALARFNPDGTLDTGFGSNGGVLTTFPGTIGQGANALALQTDGRIVAAGFANPPSGGTEFAVARYLGDPIGATPVKIDIKPSDFPNVIDLGSKGTTPVAVLSTADFNASKQVNMASLKFGRTGNESSLASCSPPQDVNKDGLLDVLCHFNAQKAGFRLGDTQGVLTGMTVGGVAIRGIDSVVVVSRS